jgi:hypothetical protein
VDDVDLYYFEGLRPIYLHDLDQLERRILIEICYLLAQTGELIAQLARSVRYLVEADIPGDLVECGVYKGASIVCIIRTLQAPGDTDRRIWLYDTFEGMPRPEAIDAHYAKTPEEDGEPEVLGASHVRRRAGVGLVLLPARRSAPHCAPAIRRSTCVS